MFGLVCKFSSSNFSLFTFFEASGPVVNGNFESFHRDETVQTRWFDCLQLFFRYYLHSLVLYYSDNLMEVRFLFPEYCSFAVESAMIIGFKAPFLPTE